MVLDLNEEERDQLLRLLERELEETRSEFRRTDNPEWRDSIDEEKGVLSSLYKRLKMADEAVIP
jgi:hypothetical protein